MVWHEKVHMLLQMQYHYWMMFSTEPVLLNAIKNAVIVLYMKHFSFQCRRCRFFTLQGRLWSDVDFHYLLVYLASIYSLFVIVFVSHLFCGHFRGMTSNRVNWSQSTLLKPFCSVSSPADVKWGHNCVKDHLVHILCGNYWVNYWILNIFRATIVNHDKESKLT